MEKYLLRNKTVVIVGAEDEIAMAIASALIVRYNCKIIAISKNLSKMQYLGDRLGEYSNNLDFEIFDPIKEKKWLEFSEKMSLQQTNVDVLINCCAYMPKIKGFEAYNQDDIDRTINVNFFSAVFSIRYLLTFMKNKKNPAIINISCITSILSVPGTSIYSASRAALKSYTEILQEELSGFYIAMVHIGFAKTSLYCEQAESTKIKITKSALLPQKAANKIIAGLVNKRSKIYVGYDAVIFARLNKHFPKISKKIQRKWFNKKGFNV